MKKINKKIIIIFSLILSILFLNINITPVYCLEDEEQEEEVTSGPNFNSIIYAKEFDYNLFNANIIPFFVDDNGIGFYYTGDVPEVCICDCWDTEYSHFDLNNDDVYNLGYRIVDTSINYFYTLNNMHKNNATDEEISDYVEQNGDPCGLRVQYNMMKTHWYYYNGKYLEIYTNSSPEFTDINYSTDLVEFLIKDTSHNRRYINFKNNYLDKGYKLINYALTKNFDNKLGEFFSNTLNFSTNTQLFNNCTNSYYYNESQMNILYGFMAFDLSNNRFYDTRTFKASPYASNLDNSNVKINKFYYIDSDENSIINDYDNIGIYYSYDKNVLDTYFYSYVDFAIQSQNKYYRIYLKEELSENNRPNKEISYNIKELKKKCPAFQGDYDDVQIVGVGLFLSDNEITDYKTLSYNLEISNHSYIAFNYTTNNSVCYSAKVYYLYTSAENWRLTYYYSCPTNEDGDLVTEGNEDAVIEGTLDNFITFLDWFLTPFQYLQNLANNFILFLKSVFLDLPLAIQYCFLSFFSIAIIFTLLKIIRG